MIKVEKDLKELKEFVDKFNEENGTNFFAKKDSDGICLLELCKKGNEYGFLEIPVEEGEHKEKYLKNKLLESNNLFPEGTEFIKVRFEFPGAKIFKFNSLKSEEKYEEPEWLQRVRKEKEELAERMSELSRYLGNHSCDTDLLSYQLEVMMSYLNILNQRIEDYNLKEEEKFSKKEEK